MQRTLPCLLPRGVFSMFSKSKPAEVNEATKLTQDQQEKLRSMMSDLRTDAPRPKTGEVAADLDSNELLDHRVDIDSIRARGLMKYRYNYAPPVDVKEVVLNKAATILKEEGNACEDVLNFKFGKNNALKSKVILAISSHLKHSPTNSRLLHLKNVSDLVEFFAEPVQNITDYTKLARSQLPSNIHLMEQPVRFNPEDKEAWHGGVTAFPGTGGEVMGLRNKRLLRQFKPKSDWFDYEEQSFDYTRPDKDMPWDREVGKIMDRYPDKRYNLSTKTFTRVK